MNSVLDRSRIEVEPSKVLQADEVLTEGALEFLAELHERFNSRRLALLDARLDRQARFDSGELPDFPEDTREIREAEWTVGSIPEDLRDRRVEITGPTNAKMLINALNSGAKVFMLVEQAGNAGLFRDPPDSLREQRSDAQPADVAVVGVGLSAPDGIGHDELAELGLRDARGRSA